MTIDRLARTIDERIATYRQRLDQHGATPLLCIGVADLADTRLVCLSEDLNLIQVRALLIEAIVNIDQAIAAKTERKNP